MRLLMLVVLLGGVLFAQTPTPVAAEQKTQDQAPSVKELADLPTFHWYQERPVAASWVTAVPTSQPQAAYLAAIDKFKMAMAAAHVCAIPLLNVLHTDPHDAISIPLPSPQEIPTAEVKPPAPSCDDKKR
jgi:hypothetical protein